MKATEAGIIEFYTDGYEGVTKDTFTNDMLDSTSYEKRDLSQADIVNAGDPVYKLVTDETWNIIIPLDDLIDTYAPDYKEAIEKAGYDVTVPVVVSNSNLFKSIEAQDPSICKLALG